MDFPHFLQYFLLSVLAVTTYTLTYCFYNAFLHPLRKYPGPKTWAASFFCNTWYAAQGRLPYAVKELHDKYGEVVRIGPNTLSYNSGQAWEDIYGHIKGNKTKNFEKDPEYRGETVSGAPNIITANDADHRRFRRLQSHAFSEKALSAQEQYLQKYVRTFISGLHDQVNSESKGVVTISDWFNFTTFDLIGDLTFGHSFGCTESGKLHPWVAVTFDYIKAMEYNRISRIFPSVAFIASFFVPKSLKEVRINHAKWSAERTQERLKIKTDRKDFMSYMLSADAEKSMSNDELNEASTILILAGSETTANLLTGATFHILRRPEIYKKLQGLIRETFKADTDIDSLTLANMKYLNACLEESLRLFPPAPALLPRVSPPGGDIVCGEFVPEGTLVGITQWAATHSERNFKESETFYPERWLGDPRFDGDNRKASQAFAYGPRNCIGKNLAWAEMRVLLANLLWNFDLELLAGHDWPESNKIYSTWEKPNLKVKLTPRQA